MHPKFFRLRQRFERPRVEDVPGEVRRELEKLNLGSTIRPGQSVAITAGSRGIANIPVILRAAVDHLKGLGASPFIVPAMGSHGGATAEGQRGLLADYGITEAQCGCQIRASMETVVVGHAPEGFPIHFDRHAHEADHVLVCARVKPHTAYAGPIESGLVKMMLIGLGKRDGAQVYHAAFQDYSFSQIVDSVAPLVLAKCPIAAGLAVVENGYDETARIAAVAPGQFLDQERELLVLARRWMPRLPFSRVDILLVDEMGKNISGVGMDSNVVGRKRGADQQAAAVKRIVPRSLTPESHGNAIGIGQADFCTRRLADAIDQHSTWVNSLTSGDISGAKMPLVFDSDREILDAALPTIGLTPPEKAKVLWIHNTLDVVEVVTSAAYLPEAEARDDLEVLSELRELRFDAQGNLPASQADF